MTTRHSQQKQKLPGKENWQVYLAINGGKRGTKTSTDYAKTRQLVPVQCYWIMGSGETVLTATVCPNTSEEHYKEVTE